MKTTNKPANGRRRFLHAVVTLAAGLSIAWVNGCESKEDKKILPEKPDRFPPKEKSK